MTLKVLKKYKDQVNQIIEKNIQNLGPKTKLRDVCEYALTAGGKRWRPIIVLMVSKALNKGFVPEEAALAIECFHTASLIADDLPCMDNDDERRGKPTVHKVFGETNALLASYALISSGYSLIQKNSMQPLKNADKRCSLAIKNASYNTGLLGATGGQFLDISPPNSSLETLKTITKQKTASLFELSFVLGWLFGEGEEGKLPQIKEISQHLGYAFQLVDDILDIEQDQKSGRQANFTFHFGIDGTINKIKEEISSYESKLKTLNINTKELTSFIDPLIKTVYKK